MRDSIILLDKFDKMLAKLPKHLPPSHNATLHDFREGLGLLRERCNRDSTAV